MVFVQVMQVFDVDSCSVLSVGDRERIFAHRGHWLELGYPKNSEEALAASVSQGFSVETDIRDYRGQVVISHDPPTPGTTLPPLEFLLDLVKPSQRLTLALNVKSDGLGLLMGSIHCNHFFFDMSFPERVRYFRDGRPVAERQSEYEPIQESHSKGSWVWLDMFERDWVLDGAYAFSRPTVLVSPELHGRNPARVWQWARANWATTPISICTDMPMQFEEFLAEGGA